MASLLIVLCLLALAVAIVWLAVRWHFIWTGASAAVRSRSIQAEVPSPSQLHPVETRPSMTTASLDPFAHAPPVTAEEPRA